MIKFLLVLNAVFCALNVAMWGINMYAGNYLPAIISLAVALLNALAVVWMVGLQKLEQ